MALNEFCLRNKKLYMSTMNYEHLMVVMEAAESENLAVRPTGPSKRVLGFMKDTNPM